jgi:4-amino-4-deoxy-L-arabinose transferase-like glycosyltransferase
MTPKARRQDEAAFLAGACCALQAVFWNPGEDKLTDYIPPAWILAPMCGRLLADLKKRNEGE